MTSLVGFDVVLVICSTITGNCFEHRIGKWADRMPTPWECAHHGQLEALEFMKTHPNYKLAKFGCDRARENA